MQKVKAALEKRRQHIKALRQKHHRLIAPAALLVGFFLDTLTLDRASDTFDNLVFVVHLFVVGSAMLLIAYRDRDQGIHQRPAAPASSGPTWKQTLYATRAKIWGWAAPKIAALSQKNWIPAAMLFSFGGLYSGFVVLYAKSSAWLTSWPLLAILLVVMLATEFFQKPFRVRLVQLGGYLTAWLLYLTFTVPIIFGTISNWTFFVACGVTGMIGFFYTRAILQAQGRVPEITSKIPKTLKTYGVTAGVVGLFLGLYFLRVIPPIPLILTFDGVYYDVTRDSSTSYIGTYQTTGTLNPFKRSHSMTRKPGEPLYVFTSVFTPAQLRQQTIFHHWQYFNENRGRWQTTDRIAITISSGREKGFRGYTNKRNLRDGRWRVITETNTRRQLGQTRFRVTTDASQAGERSTESL